MDSKSFDKDFSLSGILKVDEAKLEASTGRFEVSPLELSKLEPAALDQDLFDKIFGEGAVSSEEEFKARIKADAELLRI